MSQGRFTDMLKTAAMQARIGEAIYEGRAAVRDLAKYCNASHVFVESAYVRGAVFGFFDHCHIVICGSDDWHDVVQNLTAEIDSRDFHPMHAGFRQSSDLFYSSLMRTGARCLWVNRKLYIGGHSCGGAIAQALSSDALAPEIRPSEVYSFGSPRVFSPQLAARYSADGVPMYRFVMPGDLVPHMPLRKFRRLFNGAGYAHAGIEMHLGDDGTIETDPAFTSTTRVIQVAGSVCSLLARRPWRVVTELKRRHSMNRYSTAINKAIARVDQ